MNSLQYFEKHISLYNKMLSAAKAKLWSSDIEISVGSGHINIFLSGEYYASTDNVVDFDYETAFAQLLKDIV